MKSVLSFAHCGAGAEYIGQSVEVIDLSAPDILNSLSCSFNRTAKLAGNDDLLDIQVFLRVDAAFECLFTKLPCIRGGSPDNCGLIGLENEQKSFTRESTSPDAQCAKILCADNIGAAYIQ